MSEKSRLLKNTGLIAIGNFGAKMISFLLLPLYTSILSTSEYGTYDYIVAVSAFLLPVVTVSMHEAMFRFIIESGNHGEQFNKIISSSFLTILFGISFLGCTITGLHFFTSLQNLLYIWIYTAASSLYTFSNNLLRGMGKIKEYAIISSCKNILQLILNVLVIAVLRWGMKGLLFSLCVSEALAFLVVAYMSKIWRYIRLRYISIEQLKLMLNYSIPLIPNALSAQVINLSDRLIISAFMGSSSNGIYSVSYKFPNMIETVYHYFYTAWSESASRVIAKGKEEATKYYQSLYVLISNLIFSVVILMIAGMPVLFRIFVRGDYVQGFGCIPLLMFAMYFDSLAKFYSGLFTAIKQTRVMATSTVFAAIVNVTVNIVLIHWLGLYAAAGSTLIADIVLVIIRHRHICSEFEICIDYRRIVIELVLTLIIVVLYSYDNWVKIVLSILVAGAYALIVNRSILLKLINMVKVKIKR